MFKVATWNVNSVNARLERLVPFLRREHPDVLCLQELKCVEEKFPAESIRDAGYEYAAYGQKTYNGVAILSRTPITDIAKSFGDGVEDPAARFLAATVNGVRVISAYIPNGQAVGADKYFYKLEWLKRLRRYLDRHYTKETPLLLSGDFNVAPEDRDVHDSDLWKGKILCSEAERDCLSEVMNFGFQDTFRLHHQEPGLFSWWDYRDLSFPKNKGLRIDFVLATPPLARKCVSASIDRDERKGKGASDHAPVIAVFEA